MSDFLTVHNSDIEAVNRLLREWAATRPWAAPAQVQPRSEPAELIIHGRNAIRLMKGKHKRELAELVLMLGRHDVSVAHVRLRGEERDLRDLSDWALTVAARNGP